MSEIALQLERISKRYNNGMPNEVTVLNGASLAIKAGEVVGLIAPSGAGKSTLLHIAGLLDVADEGEISVGDKEFSSATDQERTTARRDLLGFVYQFHHLLPEFTASENIELPQLAHGGDARAAKQRAMDLLERVGLRERAHHRPAELSGGEQQRVAFCRALANSPKVLLADEPTGNLDPATSETVFTVLMDLVRSTGLAALIATHNHDLADRMDRKVKLENGILVET